MHALPSGLHQAGYGRDSCGFGLIASLADAPSHWLVRTAMTSLNRLTHRGAIAADGKTGDGCGLLLKRPEGFLRAVDRKSTRLNSSHSQISYAVFCLKKKNKIQLDSTSSHPVSYYYDT